MRRRTLAEYGHMHLSLFYRRVLALDAEGLMLGARHYPWQALGLIEEWQQPWPGVGYVKEAKLLPRARLTLLDGRSVLLRGDVLVKRGRPLGAGHADAFSELLAELRARRQQVLQAMTARLQEHPR